MSGPWEKYGGGAQAAGPWTKYGAGKPGLVDQATGFMANVNRGLGVGDEIAGALQALPGAAQALLRARHGGGLGGVADAFKQGMATQRGTEDAYAADHPTMAALGRGTGMAATAVVPGGPMLQGARLGNMGRGAVTAGLSGAAYAAADRGSVDERLQAAHDTAVNPMVLGLGAGAGALARTTPRTPRPANSEAARLTERGVPTLMGDRAGPSMQRLEDAAESLPMTGAAIRARKTEAIQGFNNTAINEALAPLGVTVKGAGRKAVGEANDAVSSAYNAAVEGIQVVPDQQYLDDLNRIVTDPKVPETVRQEVGDFLDEFVTTPLSSDPSGRAWKEADSVIGAEKRAIDAGQPRKGARSLKRALSRAEDAHWALIERQHPQAAEQISVADHANAGMERIRKAAGATGTASRDGLFTAGDLNSAVASANGRSGRRAYGQGTALLQGLTDDAQAVLPSKVPDSGTALRAILGRYMLGGGGLAGLEVASGGAAPAGALALGTVGVDALGAALYSKTVQDALRRSYLARQSGAPAGLLSAPAAARAARTGGLLATPQAAPRN